MVNDDFVFTTLLDGCVRHNRVDLAEVILVDLEHCGVKPIIYTLGVVVKLPTGQVGCCAPGG